MRGLIKFVKLPAPEQRFFLRAVVLLGYYRLALLVTPLQRLLKRLPNRPAPVLPKHRLDAPRMARLIKAAGSLVPGATCLSNSLAGQQLFAGQGYRTRLHIGVANDRSEGFQAHAWLTLADHIVVGQLPDMEKYRELPDPNPRSLN
jgi:hypothetical protein